MNPPLPIRIVSSAARAIAEAADWWATNRPKAPDAFITDLESALQLIALHPGIGARVRYHLYYRVTPEPAIEVLALWHTSREVSPEL